VQDSIVTCSFSYNADVGKALTSSYQERLVLVLLSHRNAVLRARIDQLGEHVSFVPNALPTTGLVMYQVLMEKARVVDAISKMIVAPIALLGALLNDPGWHMADSEGRGW
jgi:hypothetical protein